MVFYSFFFFLWIMIRFSSQEAQSTAAEPLSDPRRSDLPQWRRKWWRRFFFPLFFHLIGVLASEKDFVIWVLIGFCSMKEEMAKRVFFFLIFISFGYQICLQEGCCEMGVLIDFCFLLYGQKMQMGRKTKTRRSRWLKRRRKRKVKDLCLWKVVFLRRPQSFHAWID